MKNFRLTSSPRRPHAARQRAIRRRAADGGFSLLELLIAMTVTLILMAAASTLLSTSLRARTRENARSEALADAQRAVNLMTREIGNSGFGIQSNGIVAANSGPAAIRFRANVHNEGESAGDPLKPLATVDPDEDVTYVFQPAARAIVRYDRNANAAIVIASPVNDLSITYLNAAAAPLNIAGAPALALDVVKVRFTVRVTLPALTNQQAQLVQLTSDVELRNAPAVLNRY